MSLPTQVRNCLYLSSLLDIKTYVDFAHCKHIQGGEECIRAIPVGAACLNSDGNQLPNLSFLSSLNSSMFSCFMF